MKPYPPQYLLLSDLSTRKRAVAIVTVGKAASHHMRKQQAERECPGLCQVGALKAFCRGHLTPSHSALSTPAQDWCGFNGGPRKICPRPVPQYCDWDLVWRQGLCRCKVKLRSYWRSWRTGHNPMTVKNYKRNQHRMTLTPSKFRHSET